MEFRSLKWVLWSLDSVFIPPTRSSHSNFTSRNVTVTDAFVEEFSTDAIEWKRYPQGLEGCGSKDFSIYRCSWEWGSRLNAVILLMVVPSGLPGSAAQWVSLHAARTALSRGLGLQCPGVWLTVDAMSCLSGVGLWGSTRPPLNLKRWIKMLAEDRKQLIFVTRKYSSILMAYLLWHFFVSLDVILEAKGLQGSLVRIPGSQFICPMVASRLRFHKMEVDEIH